MIKKLSFIAASLLTLNANATVVTSTQIDPVTKGRSNAYTEVFSGHNYTISNASGGTQTVEICYTTTACPEYPANTRTIHECEQVTVNDGQTKSGSKLQDLKAVFKFYGWCNTTTTTELKGWQGHSSSAAGKLDITP